MTGDSGGGRFPRITEEGLDALRRRIGVRIQDSLEPWCHEATRDNIRHYAHGIGDDNPLWCDPAYARTTRYGDVIAPPSFLFACSRIISGYVGGLPGIHAMWAGADWRWHRVVPRNTEVHTEAWLKDLVLHETRFAGRAVQQIYHVDFYDGDGNLLCGRIAGASAPSATPPACRAPSTTGSGGAANGAIPRRSWTRSSAGTRRSGRGAPSPGGSRT